MTFSIPQDYFILLIDLYQMATAERKRNEEAMAASPLGSPDYVEAAVQAAEAAGRQADLVVTLLNLTREAVTCPVYRF